MIPPGGETMFGSFRIIDLSVPLAHQAVSEPMPADIHYVTHDGEGREQIKRFLGVRPEDLVYSHGLGWAVEEVRAITHTGTHVDAPYHYAPVSEGKPARTIDEVPLEWCFAPGVVVDVRHKAAGEFITVDDLKTALEAIEHRLQPRDIVLLQTGADKRLGTADYFAQPGLGQIVDGDEFPGRFVPHVDHNAGGKTPFERHLVDRAGWPAFRLGAVMVRGVDVRAGVRDRLDPLDGPAVAVGVDQVGRRHAEELFHLRQTLAVVTHVLDLRGERLAPRQMLERNAQIDQFQAGKLHGRSRGQSANDEGMPE
jgi:kynurenine formamidase